MLALHLVVQLSNWPQLVSELNKAANAENYVWQMKYIVIEITERNTLSFVHYLVGSFFTFEIKIWLHFSKNHFYPFSKNSLQV